jgi:hypothetical protein
VIEILDPDVVWIDGQQEPVTETPTFELVEICWREWLVAEQMPPGRPRDERMAATNWAAWRAMLAQARQTVH